MTIRRLAFTLVLLSSLPSLAHAQTATATAPRVEIGQKVWVTNLDGFELHGDIREVSPSFIDLYTGAGIKRIAMSEVAAIERKDSNKSGFVIGAAIGCVVEGLTAQSINDSAHSSYYSSSNSTIVGPPAAYCVVGGLLFGGIGAWLDSLSEGRDVVYRKSADRPVVRVAPIVEILGAKRVGVGGSITWR